ncbi:hypothetical protein IC235_14535 [Hymenobacter sp. BT664]|uniref:Uncharacterized protein n=1 Tax=Hymenobacter montanus TaxID=2771359 RepID=A0A927BFR7_9BACT|nr:hypothetical protein [Hymenobacter montanus]MBD2769108.1 hypothetical protein [Hymenobacter montanus]
MLLCPQRWDLDLSTSARNLARELAKQHRVLYVNLPLDVGTLLSGLGRGGAPAPAGCVEPQELAKDKSSEQKQDLFLVPFTVGR